MLDLGQNRLTLELPRSLLDKAAGGVYAILLNLLHRVRKLDAFMRKTSKDKEEQTRTAAHRAVGDDLTA